MRIRSFLDLDPVPLDANQTGDFVDLCMRDEIEKRNGKAVDFTGQHAEELKRCGGLDFWTILHKYGGHVSLTVAMTCIQLSSNKGDIILWAWTMCILHKKLNRRVEFDDFVGHFPRGIPSKINRELLWCTDGVRL